MKRTLSWLKKEVVDRMKMEGKRMTEGWRNKKKAG